MNYFIYKSLKNNEKKMTVTDDILEASEILLSMKEDKSKLILWQKENGGHTYYRDSVFKGIKNVLKKKTNMDVDLIVSDDMIENIAIKLEFNHFTESSSLEDYMDAGKLMKRINERIHHHAK